jgi:hypothetical protein
VSEDGVATANEVGDDGSVDESVDGAVASPDAHDAGADDSNAARAPEAGGPDEGRAPVKLAFGGTCETAEDCETNVCFAFGDGTRHCSEACGDATTCPVGAHGQKCNGKGFCAY